MDGSYSAVTHSFTTENEETARRLVGALTRFGLTEADCTADGRGRWTVVATNEGPFEGENGLRAMKAVERAACAIALRYGAVPQNA